MSKLIEALREKYRTPGDVLRALALDENLLREEAEMKPNKDEVARTGLKGMIAQDASLAEITEFLKTLNASETGGGSEEDGDDVEEDDVGGLNAEANSGALGLAENDGEHGGEEGASDEPVAKLHAMIKDKLSPEELAKFGELLEQIAAPDGDEDDDPELDGNVNGKDESEPEEDDAEGEDEDKDEEDEMTQAQNETDLVTKPAMDAAIKAAVTAAEKRAAEKSKATRDAERAVRPYVGELAMDAADADAVYRKALTMLGVDGADAVHASALPILLKQCPLPGSIQPRREVIAQDSANSQDFFKRFPNAARITRA